MLNAASSLRGRGPWVINGGWEYTVVLADGRCVDRAHWSGSISVDHALGLDWSTAWGVGGIALGVAAAIATLCSEGRQPARPAPPAGGDERQRREAA